ncbi:hypothetical protein DXG01_001000 [Tephrocybe rancida]|nr:hypothetical protein DXG01_001000 [Tephrocybe rancida]
MKLPLDLVACICHLPKLDHLDLRMCTITKKAQRVLLLDARGVLSSTVRNLDIMAAGERSPCNLVPHEISTFAEWIQEASQGATPPLTHLKITVERNMFDADIIRLLQAADTAPLEVLSIDGASQADLYLLTG